MHHIYSTLTCDTLYVDYRKVENLNVRVDQVLIKGGANVATEGMRAPITPHGAVTQVNDDQLQMLENCFHFQEHVKKGFIKVDREKINLEKAERNIEKSVKDMTPKDESAPRVEKELKNLKVKEFKRGE